MTCQQVSWWILITSLSWKDQSIIRMPFSNREYHSGIQEMEGRYIRVGKWCKDCKALKRCMWIGWKVVCCQLAMMLYSYLGSKSAYAKDVTLSMGVQKSLKMQWPRSIGSQEKLTDAMTWSTFSTKFSTLKIL